MDWKFWLPIIIAAIGSLYQVLSYYQAKRAMSQEGVGMRRPYIAAGICMLLTWAAIAFHYYDFRGGVRAYTPATPCQMRIGEGEREKIWNYLKNHDLQRGKVKKIEIVVERGRKDDCLYAEDLKDVFEKISWGPVVIIEADPPDDERPFKKVVRGKAVWFENSGDDEFAPAFWMETLCSLSQDFYHENQTDVFLKEKWMFYVRDSEEGWEPYSPEVICPDKPADQSPPPQPGE